MAWAARSDLAYVGEEIFAGLIRGIARLRQRLEEEQERQRNEQAAIAAEPAYSRPRAYAKTRLLGSDGGWKHGSDSASEQARNSDALAAESALAEPVSS